MGHLLGWGLPATAPLLGGVTLEVHKGHVAVFWTKKGPPWQRWHRAGSRVLPSPARRSPPARLPLRLTACGADGETEAGEGQAGSGSHAGLVAEPGPAPAILSLSNRCRRRHLAYSLRGAVPLSSLGPGSGLFERWALLGLGRSPKVFGNLGGNRAGMLFACALLVGLSLH